MATSVEAAGIAQMPRFIDRVNFYVVKAAVAAMAEDPTTAGHTKRVEFAVKVFSEQYKVRQYAAAVLSNLTVLSRLSDTASHNGVSDTDMQDTVNLFYNAFAGVST
jgi:hypothetical protein